MDTVNFLPERIKRQRARRRRLTRQAYMLAACAALMALLGYLRQGRIAQAHAELSLLNDRERNVRQQLAVRRSLERQQGKLVLKKRIDDHLGSRVKALDILAEIGRIMPASMALTQLELEVAEVRIPIKLARPPRRSARAVARSAQKKYEVTKRLKLVLVGLSPTDVDVANFIGQLSASPLFEDVNMGYAKNVEFRNRKAREFEVSCYVIR